VTHPPVKRKQRTTLSRLRDHNQMLENELRVCREDRRTLQDALARAKDEISRLKAAIRLIE